VSTSDGVYHSSLSNVLEGPETAMRVDSHHHTNAIGSNRDKRSLSTATDVVNRKVAVGLK
jgi:hypothetical protein